MNGLMPMPMPMSGAPNSIQGGLLGTAQNYGYPLTAGLLGAIGNAGGVQPFAQSVSGAPQTDWSKVALQMAGNPHAGPYPQVPLPSGVGIPGAVGGAGSSGGSSGSSIGSGLLSALSNPSTLKNVTGLLGQLVDPNMTGAANAIDSALPTATNEAVGGTPVAVTPPVTQPDQNLYSGASNADATTAANEADAYAAAGGIAGAGGLLASVPSAAAPAGAVGVYDMAGNLLAGSSLDAAAPAATEAAAGADAAGTAAADAGATAAGAGSATPATGLLGTAAAGSLAAAGLVLPILSAFGVIGDDTLPPGAAFVKSLQGAPGAGPNADLLAQQANAAYGQLGEAGFGQWLNQVLSNGGTIQAPAGTPKMRNKPT